MAEVVDPPPTFRPHRLLLGAVVVALVGFVLLALGLVVDPARAWLSYLMAYAFAFTICVGGLIFLLIGYAANARWMAVVRRATEAVTLPLPALALLFVPLLFGIDELYVWHTLPAELAEHERHILEHRAPYLNTAFIALRAVLYFVILVTAAHLLRRWSVRRDRDVSRGDARAGAADPVEALARERRFASGMLPPVGLAFTFASVDWVLSLQGVWYSSMFPVNLFAGGFLTAIALVTIFTHQIWQRHAGAGAVTPHHFHALGRMLFAFTVFWTYTAFFQALLIRIANKPEEVVYYLARLDGIWEGFAYVLILGHFVLPFLILLPRAPKFRPRTMAMVAGWLVLMHLVDIYWIVIPAHVDGGFGLHWLDLGALAAVVGTAVATAAWRQRGVALIAIGDPFLPKGAAYRSPL